MLVTDFVWMPKPRWVETPDQAMALLSYLSESGGGPVAVDTETNGLDREKSIVVCWSLSDGRRRYVIRAELLDLFRDFFRTYPRIIFHNANFDTAMLRNSGVDMDLASQLGRRYDTMIMHQWLNQDVPHKLEWIAENELSLWKVGYTDTFGKVKRRRGEPAQAPIIDPTRFGDESYRSLVAEYATLDAYLTYLAWVKFDDLLRRNALAKPYYEVETQFQDCIYLMERNGVCIDVNRLESYRPIYAKLIEEIERKFNADAGYPVNLDSTPQLQDFFYTRRRKNVEKLTPGGDSSTDKSVLVTWAKRDKDPYAQMLLDYRTLRQQRNVYVEGILQRVRSGWGSRENRLFTTYTMDVAATGRLSSVDPNLQNIVTNDKIPEDLLNRGVSFRDVFVPAPGREFWVGDYSQLEMCVGAHLSKDALLIDTIKSGKDTHSMTASRLNGFTYEDVHAAKKLYADYDPGCGEELPPLVLKMVKARKVAKPVNFGIFYGMGPKRLAEQTGMSIEESALTIERFFKTYPGIKNYIDVQHTQVALRGYVRTLLGRKRFIEGGRARDYKTRGEAERKAANCVDFETEALTQRGWVRGPDLTLEDQLLTKNLETGVLEWQQPTDLRVFPDYEGPLVEFRSRSFSAVSTPDHRWPVYTKGTGRNECKLTRELSDYGDHRIHRTGAYEGAGGEYADDLVELAGWYLTDGCGRSGRTSVSLYQSARAKPRNVDSLDRLVRGLGVPFSRYVHKDGTEKVTWSFSGALAEWLRVHFPGRLLTVEFVRRLSGKQCMLLLHTMMLGDGTAGTKDVFTTQRKEGADAFQALACMCGIATSAKYRDMSRYHPKSSKLRNVPKMTGCWYVTLLRRDKVQVLRRQKREFTEARGVWCPVVPNTYFVARRLGHVYVTGNTPVQGTAADVVRLAMIKLATDRVFRENGLSMHLQVHDELVIEGPVGTDPSVYKHVSDVMSHPFNRDLLVPLRVSGKVGASWGAAK